MDAGFFRSRQFAVSGVLAALVLGGGAWALSEGEFGWSHYSSDGCPRPTLRGESFPVAPREEREPSRRAMTYALDASGLSGGVIDMCSAYGELLVEPSTDGNVTLEQVVLSGSADLLEAARLSAAFARDGDRLSIGAWEGPVDIRARTFSSRGLDVLTTLRVPEGLAWEVRLDSSFGDVRVSRVVVGNVTLTTSHGEILALGLVAEGDLTLDASHGDVLLEVVSLAPSRVEVESGYGDVELRLPRRADIGYDVRAESAHGDVDIRVGDAEVYETDREGIGMSSHVRTRGYADAATRVEVAVETRLGDVVIVSQETTA